MKNKVSDLSVWQINIVENNYKTQGTSLKSEMLTYFHCVNLKKKVKITLFPNVCKKYVFYISYSEVAKYSNLL